MSVIVSTNPAKGYEKIGEVNCMLLEHVDEYVAKSCVAQKSWRNTSLEQRKAMVQSLVDIIKKRQDSIAEMMTRETGKLLTESRSEMKSGFDQYYIDHVHEFLEPEVKYEDEKRKDIVYHQARGVAAVGLPWNYPFYHRVWGVIPHLLVGNTVVRKHSSECPLTAQLLNECVRDSNLPDDVCLHIVGGSKHGQRMMQGDIDVIHFTGSSRVGRLLNTIAGEKMIPAVINGSGSSPAIILEDADLDLVIPIVLSRRFGNCGQICTAIKRLLVHESLFGQVFSMLQEKLNSFVIGSPMNESSNLSSLSSKQQLDTLQNQLVDAEQLGATIHACGPSIDHLDGAYMKPVMVTDVKPTMKLWHEETFGPILPLVPFATEEEAIELANDSVYGLSAHIFGQDQEQAERVMMQLEAGGVYVNHRGGSKPWKPTCGWKISGASVNHAREGFAVICRQKVVTIGK